MATFFGTSGGLTVSALRGKQGDRDVYALLPSLGILDHHFSNKVARGEQREQRHLDEKRASDIADYVCDKDDYVLGAITYAVNMEPRFEEFEPGSGVGRLFIPYQAKLRTVDGQHRREGVKQALEVQEELATQGVVICLYVEPSADRRRQMFSDMNSHQKPVSKSINVSFNQRDPFARAVQGLVGTHELLKDRVEMEKASVSPSSTKLFTLGAVYDCLLKLYVGMGGRVRKRDEYKDAAILTEGTNFFALLLAARPELQEIVSGSIAPRDLRPKSILASSTTIRVLAGAHWTCVRGKDGVGTMTRARFGQLLAQIDFDPGNEFWSKNGFVTPGKTTPNSRLQEMRRAADAIATEIRRLDEVTA